METKQLTPHEIVREPFFLAGISIPSLSPTVTMFCCAIAAILHVNVIAAGVLSTIVVLAYGLHWLHQRSAYTGWEAAGLSAICSFFILLGGAVAVGSIMTFPPLHYWITIVITGAVGIGVIMSERAGVIMGLLGVLNLLWSIETVWLILLLIMPLYSG